MLVMERIEVEKYVRAKKGAQGNINFKCFTCILYLQFVSLAPFILPSIIAFLLFIFLMLMMKHPFVLPHGDTVINITLDVGKADRNMTTIIIIFLSLLSNNKVSRHYDMYLRSQHSRDRDKVNLSEFEVSFIYVVGFRLARHSQ